MDYDPGNIFARILRGEAPAHVVHSDDHALAFMDVMPQTAGHTLVIPRVPALDLFDVPADALGHLMGVTQRVAAAVDRAFRPAGVMIAQLSRAGAGQSVFHLHFHILPRHAGVDFTMHARGMAEPAVLAEHARRIRAELGA